MSEPKENRDAALGGKLTFASTNIANGLLFISGQGPLERKTLEYVPRTIEEETQMTLDKIDSILEEKGCTRKEVVKCTVWLSDLDDYTGFNATYMKFFDGHLPARSTVGSPLLRGIKVEIEAVAKLPGESE